MSIVFFDLDGTLVDEDGNIPPSAALAIRRLRENGHYCVVNTGLPSGTGTLRWMRWTSTAMCAAAGST